MVCNLGFLLGNADITIVTESPRLSSYIDEMRSSIADALDIDVQNISVKATTEEKLGFTGSGMGLSATAVVLLLST
jgi:2-C-methyl-D-erythritol 2,4-cyclodiphosphate synthase